MTGIKRRKSSLLGALAVLTASCFLVAGCGLLPEEEEELAPPLMQPVKIEYKTQPVARGTLIMQLRMGGNFYPEVQKNLSFEKQSGRLKAKYVEYGQDVKTGDLIAELDSESLVSSIRIQELDVQKAQLTVSKLQADHADSYSIKSAKLSLQQQQYRLEDMKKQLQATRIVAPFDGRVVYLTTSSAGDSISAYQTVARLADTKGLLLVTTSDKASSLPIGALVDVEYKNQKLVGEVVANPTTLFSDPNEAVRKTAMIRIRGGLPEDARMGDDARIIFVQEKRENVLILERNLINLMSGRRYVNVLEDGFRVEKDVEIGMQTDTEAEIIKGLNEGDLVITN